MEDAEIVTLYLERNEAALTATAEKYGAALRRVAYGILGDAQAAEECENDTYLQAWNSIPPHEPKSYLFPFLGRIIRHIAIDRCRKANAAKRQGAVAELTKEMEACLPAGGDPAEALDEKALAGAINAFLATLNETQRGVFLRRYWFFDPIGDVAARYGMTKSGVKTMLFRLRERLRAYLRKEGYTV